MNPLIQTLIAVTLVSAVSLVGVFTISIPRILDRYLHLLVAFAAGTLVASALTDLIPEGVAAGGDNAYLIVIGGIVTFLILEKLLYWYHCHHGACDDHHNDNHNKAKAYTYLNLIGDAIHNLLDGAIIAVAFNAGTGIGITATVAVILHEIPQELGDFAILVHGGFTKSRAILFNFLSALTAIVGALLAIYFLKIFEFIEPLALAFSGGAFLYIALVDLIPELHHKPQMVKNIAQISAFLLGIGAIILFGLLVPEIHP